MVRVVNNCRPTVYGSIYSLNTSPREIGGFSYNSKKKGKQMNGNFARTAIKTKKINVRPKLNFGGKRF